MSTTAFESLAEVVRNRRTVKFAQMNGQQIPDEHIQSLLALADWAPTHGHTEPWRFRVYAQEGVKKFCQAHAWIYWEDTPEENRIQATFEKLQEPAQNVSHVILAWMKRGDNPKIPALEEVAAASAAIEHILLGAQALGIGAFWNTGGMTHKPAMKRMLGLGEEDVMLGILYLGYSDEAPKVGKRIVPLAEKVEWINA